MTVREEEDTKAPSPVCPPEEDDDTLDETICAECYKPISECSCPFIILHCIPT